MSKLSNSVDACLNRMSETGGTGKGTFGEEAVFKICEQLYQRDGGILYHSYTYKTSENKEGNVKRSEAGIHYLEDLSGQTEVDILFVTRNKIFAIEVKAYKAREITLTNDGISGCFMTDKSPIHQNEMHCRHLYEVIFKSIPEGRSKYIIPIVVFVDKCKVVDKRTPTQKSYVKVTVLNKIKEMIEDLDKPSEFTLDLGAVGRSLNEACIKYEKLLPYRNI